MYQGNCKLRSENQIIEYTKDLLDEYVRCKEDIIYFAEKYFYIVTIDEGKIKIPLWDFQKKVLKAFISPPHDRRHIIMMMPRQQGKCVLDDTKIQIRNKNTKEIKEVTIRTFFDMIVDNYKLEYTRK